VIRTWRRPGTQCQANYLPIIEFDPADLPWVIVHRHRWNNIKPWLCWLRFRQGRQSCQPSHGQPSDTYVSSRATRSQRVRLVGNAQLQALIFRDHALAQAWTISRITFVAYSFAQHFDARNGVTAYVCRSLRGPAERAGSGQQQGGGIDARVTPSAGLPICPLLRWSFETGRGRLQVPLRKIHPKPWRLRSDFARWSRNSRLGLHPQRIRHYLRRRAEAVSESCPLLNRTDARHLLQDLTNYERAASCSRRSDQAV